MKKVLVIADVANWAFDRFYDGLKKYCSDFEFEVRYSRNRFKTN